jgi:hypothetical protein
MYINCFQTVLLWSKKDGFYTSFKAPAGFIHHLDHTKLNNVDTRCNQFDSG